MPWGRKISYDLILLTDHIPYVAVTATEFRGILWGDHLTGETSPSARYCCFLCLFNFHNRISETVSLSGTRRSACWHAVMLFTFIRYPEEDGMPSKGRHFVKIIDHFLSKESTVKWMDTLTVWGQCVHLRGCQIYLWSACIHKVAAYTSSFGLAIRNFVINKFQ